MIYALCKINDVQVKAMSMNDLLDIELVNKFNQSWEETVMELEKVPEAGLLEWPHFTVDNWRSRSYCKMLWRFFIPINFTAQVCQEKKGDLLVTVTRKVAVQKT